MARSSKTIRPKREDDPAGGRWQGLGGAPSLVRPEEPSTGRAIALVSLFPLTLGGAALLFYLIGRPYLIAVGWGVFLLALGLGGLLYHAFNERDLQYRRLYGCVGAVFLALAVLFRLLPYEGEVGGLFLRYATPSLLIALAFLLSFVRNETDSTYRSFTLAVLGTVAALSAALGLVGGLLSEAFLVGQSVVLLIVGLLYGAAYISQQESGSPRAYWAGMAVGVTGAAMVLIALGVSLVPPLLFQWGWLSERPAGTFFMPRGLLLLYLGLEYLILGLGVCSDSRFVVLTRRELASFFCSPVAYIVLIGSSVIGWISFLNFLRFFDRQPELPADLLVHLLVFGVIPVFSVVFIVPLLTMRLLSEERRTGSLEVLLTAPVGEASVVLAKFCAALRVFLLGWYPWGLYLLALRVEGGEPFDYRPMLTFFLAMIAMGAGWIAMGLFFSSLTRNQIAAAALTLMGMLGLVALYFLQNGLSDGTLKNVLTSISFMDLWFDSSRGVLTPRDLLFHLSAAVFWLFLTVKVLEARKWA